MSESHDAMNDRTESTSEDEEVKSSREPSEESDTETIVEFRSESVEERPANSNPDSNSNPPSGEPVPDDLEDSGAETPDVDLSDPAYYLNRERSELAFQRRVLAEVTDDDNPLLERVKFLAIVTTNLDEFFRKRVGGLKQQIAAGITDETPDGHTPSEQWERVLEEARSLFERQSRCYREEI